MNPLSRAWLEREHDRLMLLNLRKIARDLRRKQKEVEPLREEAKRRRRERMRQDGPDGFVMVEK